MRKKGFDYFGAMARLAADAKEASQMLKEVISDYDLNTLHEKSLKIHSVEKDGDEVVKQIMQELYVSFITPIDREDIVHIVDRLDDILDGMNAITYEFYHLNVEKIRPETDVITDFIVKAVEEVHRAVVEFSRFKSSKELMSIIDNVNRIESEADRFYSEQLAKLFREEKDPIEVIKWKNIYDGFEEILDSCEDAADIIAGLVIKNS